MLSLNSGERYTRCRGLGMSDYSWEAHQQSCEVLLVSQLNFMFLVFWNIPERFCNEYRLFPQCSYFWDLQIPYKRQNGRSKTLERKFKI